MKQAKRSRSTTKSTPAKTTGAKKAPRSTKRTPARSAKSARKATSKRPSKLTEIDIERELKALHDQMALSLESIEDLLEGVSTEHQTIAKRHLRRFHSEQKRHLEHIKRKLDADAT